MDELNAFITEFQRYRALGEKTLARLEEGALNQPPAEATNSIAMLVRHLSGNLQSRFMNFLTEDGEKEWRDRDAEFSEARYSKAQVEQLWMDGWRVVDETMNQLSATDLDRTVRIRGVPLSVHEALARSVAHLAYHVGQIVLIARLLAPKGAWESLSIPPGGSVSYNAAPTKEKKP